MWIPHVPIDDIFSSHLTGHESAIPTPSPFNCCGGCTGQTPERERERERERENGHGCLRGAFLKRF